MPNSLTSFVGRADELRAISGALSRQRLVTLVGPGGCGKTRLAIEAARASGDRFDDGPWFARLADVGDTTRVTRVIAQAMGHYEPLDGIDPDVVLEHLTMAIGTDATLVVVDNCEHLLDGVCPLVAELLDRCHGLVVLATGREPLGNSAEHVIEIGPLDVRGSTAQTPSASAQQEPVH